MKYYIELTLIPDADSDLFFLWSKIYNQIHIGLVEMKDENDLVSIAVSFPEYLRGRFLGSKLRLFAPDEATLVKFNVTKWLNRLTDYVHCSSIKTVPLDKVKGHSNYSRGQPKLNLEQRIKHQAARRKISYEEATAHFKTLPEENELLLPYITLQSLTNKEKFSLFIRKTSATTVVSKGFGTYGLSPASTVPEF